jgi:ATP-dependent DNA helicase RecQ
MKPLEILEAYFGYKSFRKSQEDIINAILAGNDVFSIMPTGAGKSICYQIPALIFKGLTIVISPLISLMKDQVDSLRAQNIKAAYINSTLDKIEFEEILYSIKNNEYDILYIAPERLDSTEFLDAICNINVSQIAIDEAHCVSQWGHDFRVSYRKIPGFIKKLNSSPVVTAFTATASDEISNDIIRLLDLKKPKVFLSGFDRENLELTIIKEGQKNRFLQEYIKSNKEVSGIIYCATRKEVDSIYEALINAGYNVSKYHAGMKDIDRKTSQEEFINDKTNIMIATNAFGMGIDKPNIRYVIHNNMPQTIENYYQEIGRAGRDGEKSECILLFTPRDIQLQKYLIDVSTENEDRKNIAYKKLQEMTALIYSNGCYRKFILNHFGEEASENCNNCSNCISEGEVIDRTIDAQKVLSCIYRMKRGYGSNLVVDVLRGSKSSKVISLGFDELTTYGIMKEYKKEELLTFINILISNGYIDQEEGAYPVLKLNNLSIEIIKGTRKVQIKEAIKAKSKYEVNDLFNELKELRFNIATEEKVPPYIIFGDAVLKEMSNVYPQTEEEFLNISGVGQVKYTKYGESFLKIIAEYITKNNIVVNKKPTIDKKVESKFCVNTDTELYLMLKELRDKFSKREGKLPYLLIAQNTLKEISGRYPTTIEELEDITGLGPVKINKYGAEILELVNNYLEENPIKTEWTNKGRAKLVIDNEERSNEQIAIDMLEQNYPLKEISSKIEISISTILGYLTEYIKQTGDISFNLKLSEYYNEEEERDILSACNSIGIDKVSLLKKALPNNISFESIRAVILKNYYNIA